MRNKQQSETKCIAGKHPAAFNSHSNERKCAQHIRTVESTEAKIVPDSGRTTTQKATANCSLTVSSSAFASLNSRDLFFPFATVFYPSFRWLLFVGLVDKTRWASCCPSHVAHTTRTDQFG